MILLIYDANLNVVEIIKAVHSPIIDKNNVEWETGNIAGINLPFLLLDDVFDEVGVVTEELLALDKSQEFIKVDLIEENRRLKAEMATVQGAIDFIITNY